MPYVPESSIPELPMDMGNGKNSEGTGMGNSQHATTPLSSLSNPSLPSPSTSSSNTKHLSTWSTSQDIQKKKWSASQTIPAKKQAGRSVHFTSPLTAFAPTRPSHPNTIPGTSSGNATVSETAPSHQSGSALGNPKGQTQKTRASPKKTSTDSLL